MGVPVAEALPSVAEVLPPGCGDFARFLQKLSQLLVLGLEFDKMQKKSIKTASEKTNAFKKKNVRNAIFNRVFHGKLFNETWKYLTT